MRPTEAVRYLKATLLGMASFSHLLSKEQGDVNMAIPSQTAFDSDPLKPFAERLWERACYYKEAFGWSVIPVGGDKSPVVNWKQYQEVVANPEMMKLLYLNNPKVKGVAVVTGAVSGDLVCRDFDRVEAYEEWKAANPRLADSLPTVKTPSGYHVYGIRKGFTGIKYIGDGEGEMRGSGGYTLLPPSRLGRDKVYIWVNPPVEYLIPELSDADFASLCPSSSRDGLSAGTSAEGDGQEPVSESGIAGLKPSQISTLRDLVRELLDQQEGGLRIIDITELAVEAEIGVVQTKGGHSPVAGGSNSDVTETAERTEYAELSETAKQIETYEADGRRGEGSPEPLVANFMVDGKEVDLPDLAGKIAEAIRATLPQKEGTRNRRVFDLARRLVALGGRGTDNAKAWEPIVREWHKRAHDYIRTKGWAETWVDFLNGYSRVRITHGEDAVSIAIEKSEAAGMPPEVNNEEPQVQRLATICRELQRIQGSCPFFLSCRRAAPILKSDFRRANALLRYLVAIGLLEVVEKGQMDKAGGRASRYRYLGKMD